MAQDDGHVVGRAQRLCAAGFHVDFSAAASGLLRWGGRGLDHDPEKHADRRDEPTVRRWQDEWAALPKPIVPVMVRPDGYVSRGLGALTRVARMTHYPRDGDQ